jgi:hypothetical protein
MMSTRDELAGRVDAAVRRRHATLLASGEVRFRCPDPSHHAQSDAHPSARWHPVDHVWRCDVSGEGGGVVDLATRLGLLDEAAPSNRRGTPRETGRWTLRDPSGAYVAEHVRLEPGRRGSDKDCLWFVHDRPGLGGRKLRDLPLYGCHELAAAEAASPVVVTEGEKCRDALAARGIVAVGTVTGASVTPSDDVLRVLTGHNVVLWPDADRAGRDHMRRIAERLTALRIAQRTIDTWPAATDGRDAADWTGTDAELHAMLDERPWPANEDAPPEPGEWTSGARPDEQTADRDPWTRAVSAKDFLAGDDPILDWLVERLLAPGSITLFYSPRGSARPTSRTATP